MSLMVTAFYTGILGLCYMYLSGLVIRARIKGNVSLGDGGNDELSRLIRAHSNFVEYVPICLIQLACLEINSSMSWLLHLCAIALLIGRLLHAYGLRHHAGANWQRFWGMVLTFTALIALSIANLSLLYWSAML